MTFNKNKFSADVVFEIDELLIANKVGHLPVSIHQYINTQDLLMRGKNFDMTRKRIEYLQMKICNTSYFIKALQSDTNIGVVVKNKSYRSDFFTFFNMIRSSFSLNYVKTKIKIFGAIGAYPIRNLNTYRYSGLKYVIVLPS
jgi:hypothetical protein